ncbi:heterokaryon incompatibility protein [Colletotrichum orchidophilum]|uniref:Heterokaryon incompatibility protein n=1 Tax=Colletotrichum orchidophilum TaxID=1209926 RepID=A0A1G4AWA3_9PEZI|nr:heterokaryon incompatibility protein [Colletotrichum orchidophilum]OHE93332.1 heterokaryon incompatibility protein [Colletotrichum orchidophilum]
MSLCEICAKLDIEQLDATDVRFHPSLKALQRSAAAQCPFCTLCYTRVMEDTHHSITDALLSNQIPPGYKKESFFSSVWLHGEVRLGNRSTSKDLPGCAIWISCGRMYPDGGQGETNSPGMPFASRLALFASHTTPAASKYIERFITADHDPNLYMELAGWRLKKCRTSHKLCKPRSLEMPTRVIAVGKDVEKPRLKVTNGLREPYIALSYCWGPGKDTFTLTHKTKDELLDGVMEGKLTKTHQESIRFARSLGVEYLWIDALCIIQGDADDWAFESQRMAHVYGNAALTIIAGRSDDARHGFLTNRLSQNVPPCALPLGPNTKDTVGICLPRSTVIGPVSTRGWCFQEEKLSTRAIIFGKEQMIYQCREEKNWEDGQVDFQDLEPTFLTPGFSTGAPHSAADKETTLKMWYEYVDMFTMRALSNPHDIFAAIASIAKLAQDVLKSRYLAGIWEEDLVRGLLWKPRNQVHAFFNDSVTRPKPTPFAPAPVIRAPSWSWASVEGPLRRVYNPRKSKLFQDSNYVKIKPKLGTRWTTAGDCDVTALHMPSCTLQILGRPAKATLIKTGVVDWFEADTSRKRWLPYKRMLNHAVLLVSTGLKPNSSDSEERVVAAGAFDVPEEASHFEDVWGLPLIDKEGLMIVPHEGKWKRVGWFVLRNESWLQDRPEIELDLI